MVLSAVVEVIVGIVIALLIFLLFYFGRKAKKKRAKKVANGKYITDYFSLNEELRKEEYIPYKNKPINRKSGAIFMAKTFCLVLDGTKTKRINYDDIYWVYGITPKKEKSNLEEAIAICTIHGKFYVYLQSQEPYVKLFYSMNIPAGYGPRTKEKAIIYKKELKANRYEKGSSPKIQFNN